MEDPTIIDTLKKAILFMQEQSRDKKTVIMSRISNPNNFNIDPDSGICPSNWLPPREIEERIAILRALEASEQRFRRIVAGILGAVVGFILGYFTWAVWPLSGLIYRLFSECFL